MMSDKEACGYMDETMRLFDLYKEKYTLEINKKHKEVAMKVSSRSGEIYLSCCCRKGASSYLLPAAPTRYGDCPDITGGTMNLKGNCRRGWGRLGMSSSLGG